MTALKALGGALADVVAHILDESHQSRPSTYRLMRGTYVSSKGRSRLVWRVLFRTMRRSRRNAVRDDLALAPEVHDKAYAVRPGFLNAGQVRAIRSYLEQLAGTTSLHGTRRHLAAVGEMSEGVRFDYESEAILGAPGIYEILTHPSLLGAARHYLGCDPILAGVHSWWSLNDGAATSEDLSEAAQMFHFDSDWPLFIKFFIYLTDVDDEAGPFAIIEGTHRTKPLWRDGRFSEDELLRDYGLGAWERRLTGSAGTLIAADTSAFHRGTPVLQAPRLVLEIEFAISRLGASFQYPLLPASMRPDGPFKHTFDVFAGTS